jgi:7,8-dihydropterin-6-yl-methyl-4-(beta-D-ribofuranosyl)aminobenzene 5'-phosphate synthase
VAEKNKRIILLFRYTKKIHGFFSSKIQYDRLRKERLQAMEINFLITTGLPLFFMLGASGISEAPAQTQHARDIDILVIYDNYSLRYDLETGWGFSCLIRGMEKTVLFDTGGSGTKLIHNMRKMGVSPKEVDAVFLSHIHEDHTGGLEAFLEGNGDVAVYLPDSFPNRFKKAVSSYGADVVSGRGPWQICHNAFSTGEMGTLPIEQSLVLRSTSGSIVLTGCAHPGIVKIIEQAKALLEEKVLLVMGGFHLMDINTDNMEQILVRFKELGVRYVGPCHCTGEAQIKTCEKTYGEHFIKVGVGKVIRSKDLK